MRPLSRGSTLGLALVALLIACAFLIYSVSLLPDYMPYHLNAKFNGLDTDVWDIGGAKNYTASNGTLDLCGSTNATHYFVTAPKWEGPGDTPLQGSIEISFKVTAPASRSVVVASTDSWRVYVRNGSLVVEITDKARLPLFWGEALDSGWHRLIADSEANSLQMSIDGANLFNLNDWSGKLSLIVLGTSEQTVGGLRVQGTLSVDSVTAELLPLVEVNQSVQTRPHPVDSFAGASIDNMTSSGRFVAASDQYLTIPNNSNFNFGSNNFTIDFWMKFNTLPSAGYYYGLLSQYQASNNRWEVDVHNYAGTFVLEFAPDIAGTYYGNYFTITPAPTTGVWYHVAIVAYNSVYYYFWNGALLGTASNTVALNLTAPLTIGAERSNFAFLNGWLEELRISRGAARWTSNFTPPTSAYTVQGVPDAYTVLLIEFVGGFADSSPAQNTVTAHNGASIDTSQYAFSKVIFGTGVGRFVAASDQYLTVPSSTDWNFGSGNFTIDFWVRFNSLPSANNIMMIVGQYEDAGHYWWLGIIADSTGTTYLNLYDGGSNTNFCYQKTDALYRNTWYHFAVVRSGGTVYAFQNGVELGTNSVVSSAFGTYTGSLYVGEFGGGGNYHLDGWLKELRISIGVARWTSNFTPSAAEYSPDQYTVLLLHMNPTAFTDSSIGYWADTTAAQVGSSPFTALAASTDLMYFGFMDPRMNFLLVWVSWPLNP